MKKCTGYFGLFLAVFTLIGCSSVSHLTSDKLLLRNVNIVDTHNARIIPNQQIWLSDGVITGIEATQSSAPDASWRVIEGKDGYVTPGLIDMHVHVYDQSALSLALSHGVVHQRVMNGMPQILTSRYWISACAMALTLKPALTMFLNA